MKFVLIFFLLGVSLAADSEKKILSIKIIESPAQNQFAANQFDLLYGRSQDSFADGSSLKPKFRRAKFAGPYIFEQFNGLCFDYLNQDYKWVVCPFQNVTQYEKSIKWNPYRGILGIFYEWEIENDKFVALKMENGDDCGPNGSRRTRILFKCDRNSTKTEIEQAAEPSTCNYEITLSTSAICSDDDDVAESTMNVYPHLNATLKSEWDMIFSDLKNDLITEKLYNISLNRIFVKAGFLAEENEKETLRIREPNDESEPDEPMVNKLYTQDTNKLYAQFRSEHADHSQVKNLESQLQMCKQENERLKRQLESKTDENLTTTGQHY